MALVNPCENCKSPLLIGNISLRIKEILPIMDKGNLVGPATHEASSEKQRARALAVTANTVAFRGACEFISKTANSMPCPDPDNRCDRALYVMDAFAEAMDEAVKSSEEIVLGGEPPQSPTTD